MNKFIKKALICGGMASLFMATPVWADEGSIAGEPIKVQVTCYCEPGHTANGSTKTSGIIAAKREWLNYACLIYKVNDEGGLGDFLGVYEVADIGYGAPMKNMPLGSSELREGERLGTIEAGLTIDFRQPTYAACVKFMKDNFTGCGTTGSEVYALVVKGDG